MSFNESNQTTDLNEQTTDSNEQTTDLNEQNTESESEEEFNNKFKSSDFISSEDEANEQEVSQTRDSPNQQNCNRTCNTNLDVGYIPNEKDVDNENKLICESVKNLKYTYLIKKVQERALKEIPPITSSAERFRVPQFFPKFIKFPKKKRFKFSIRHRSINNVRRII